MNFSVLLPVRILGLPVTTSQRSSTAYFAGTHNIFCHERIPPPVAVVVPTVALLPIAIVVPPVTFVVPRWRAARHLLCSLEANQRNWTEPRHNGIVHDVYMEQVPLDVPNGGRRCEYNKDINDHDAVMSEIPWLCAVVDGSTLPYGRLILNPT